MFAMSPFRQSEVNGIAWYWYLLLVLVVLALIIWWIYQQSKKPQPKPSSESSPQISVNPELEGREDDLTKIEGIGPKVAKVLKEAGITSFDALSRADAGEVKAALNEAGLQMMNPEGWIEQADLAAKEDWEGLEKLQGELKGGRRR